MCTMLHILCIKMISTVCNQWDNKTWPHPGLGPDINFENKYNLGLYNPRLYLFSKLMPGPRAGLGQV